MEAQKCHGDPGVVLSSACSENNASEHRPMDQRVTQRPSSIFYQPHFSCGNSLHLPAKSLANWRIGT